MRINKINLYSNPYFKGNENEKPKKDILHTNPIEDKSSDKIAESDEKNSDFDAVEQRANTLYREASLQLSNAVYEQKFSNRVLSDMFQRLKTKRQTDFIVYDLNSELYCKLKENDVFGLKVDVYDDSKEEPILLKTISSSRVLPQNEITVYGKDKTPYKTITIARMQNGQMQYNIRKHNTQTLISRMGSSTTIFTNIKETFEKIPAGKDMQVVFKLSADEKFDYINGDFVSYIPDYKQEVPVDKPL